MSYSNPRFTTFIAAGSLSLFALFAGANASGVEVKGVKVPHQVTCADCPLVLNGTAVRKKYGFSVYVAALYLNEKTRDHQHIMERDLLGKRVNITMLREVGTDTFNSTIQKNIDSNFSAAEKQGFSDELKKFFACFDGGSELKKGSVINIDYVPESGTMVTVDGCVYDAIPGKDFYHAILRLWIGKPPQESLKTGLLGLAIN